MSKKLIAEIVNQIALENKIIKENDTEIKEYAKKMADIAVYDEDTRNKISRMYLSDIKRLEQENTEARKRINSLEAKRLLLEKESKTSDNTEKNKGMSKGPNYGLVALALAILMLSTLIYKNYNNEDKFNINQSPAATASPNPEDDFVSVATPDSYVKPANLMMVDYLEYQKTLLEEELLNADKIDPQMVRMVNQNYIDYTQKMIEEYKKMPVLDDITNNEQVNERAKYILENWVLPIMKAKGLTPNIYSNDDIERIANVESIANIIRISAPNAPVDVNGRKYFEKSGDTDSYTQIMNDKITLLDWLPFDERSAEMYFIPESIFQIDNSDSSRYIYQGDMEYYNVTLNMNNNNSAGFLQASRNLGIFQRDTIVQVGMNGGASIYNVKDAQHSSYNAAMMRFTSLNIEGHLEANKAACIYLCINNETGEWELRPVVEVYRAAKAGTFTDPTARMVGEEEVLIPFGNYAFINARNAAEEDYLSYVAEMGSTYTYNG